MSSSSLIVDYIGSGLAASRPVTPNLAAGASGVYYATDTSALSIWTGSVWATPAGSGTVTTTGSPTSGKAAMFSGAGSITPADLSATLTSSGTPVTNSIGYLGSPQNLGLDSGNVTLALTDDGKHVYHTDGNARDLTIPANGSVAFPIGAVIGGVNENGAGVITLKITSDTLRWGSSTGQRTIAANATFSLLKVASTVWRLTGDGIT